MTIQRPTDAALYDAFALATCLCRTKAERRRRLVDEFGVVYVRVILGTVTHDGEELGVLSLLLVVYGN